MSQYGKSLSYFDKYKNGQGGYITLIEQLPSAEKNVDKKELSKSKTSNHQSKQSRRQFMRGAALTGAGLFAGGASAASNAFGREDFEDQARQLFNRMNKPFKGKTAFITGGARGIGRGCAELLSQFGANIVIYDIAGQIETVKYALANQDDLYDTRTAVEENGTQCLAIQGDVRDRQHLEAAMQETVDTFGSIDFVIANAGITQVGNLDTFSDAEVSTVMDVNLGGVIKTIQAATPHLTAQESGRIIVTSSVTGRGGSAQFPVYSATKWAVIGLAKATAQALGQFNVTCNAICPDIVHTKLLDNDYILGALGVPDFATFNEMAKGFHPLPVGAFDPIEVAETVKYLCSDDARYVSGDVFDIAAGANASHIA